MPSYAPSRPRSRKRVVIPVVVVVVLILASLGAWAFDRSATAGKVAHKLDLPGKPIGGMSEGELTAAVTAVAAKYDGAYVRVQSPQGDLDTTAGAVGLHLDQPATVAAILAVDRAGSGILQPFRWAKSLFVPRAAPLVFTIDQAALAAGLDPVAKANFVAPVEPSVTLTDAGMAPIPGIKGDAIDLNEVAERLKAAAATGTTPVVISIQPKPTNPIYSDTDAKAAADKANGLAKTPLALSVGGKSATITSKQLRTWLRTAAGPTGLEVTIDQAKIVADLPALIGDLGTKPVDATVTLVHDDAANADHPAVVPGKNGSKCCAADSAARIANALTSGQTAAALDLEVVPPAHDDAWAAKLGIVEPVGSFTTRHVCCENRVTNIHLFADVVRGMLIEPGQTWSANERVGQRTKERGFLPAPVINEGTHDEDVGGGVSQFATTMFNAAFFAGLDIPDYQSHSFFIDRYPYGREATISWEKPDLKIKNNTPYGILIWPTYTDTSLTVTLWSTKFAVGDQTGEQEKSDRGPCIRVKTQRTRTYVSDGHTDVDYFYALYQKADGVKCT